MTHTSVSLRSSWRVLGVTLDCQASIRENELIFWEGPLVKSVIPEESLLILLSWIFKVKCSGYQRVLLWKQKPDMSGLILADGLAAYTCSLPFSSLVGAGIEGGAKVGSKEIGYVCWHGSLIPGGVKGARPGDKVVVNESQTSHMQAHFYQGYGLEQLPERIS